MRVRHVNFHSRRAGHHEARMASFVVVRRVVAIRRGHRCIFEGTLPGLRVGDEEGSVTLAVEGSLSMMVEQSASKLACCTYTTVHVTLAILQFGLKKEQ